MGTQNILIVDDDQDFVQLLAFDLKKSGWNVDSAGDGEQGIRKIKKDQPNLVILDLKMPNTTGEEFIKQALTLRNDLPIMVLSAYVDNPAKQDQLRGIGVKQILNKKTSREETLKAVKELLPGSS